VTLHVYALTEPPAQVPDIAGIGASRLTSISVGDVDAVASDGDSPATEEAVLAHARVVEEVFAANAAVLPVRFGTRFDDAAALRDAIGGRTEELQRALGTVRGNVEIGLRVSSEAQAEPIRAASGAEYLSGRLTQVRAAEKVADEIHAPLAAAARAATLNRLASPDVLLSAAYLVPRADVVAFERRVQELDAAHDRLTFLCTGPWPPYSFATVDAGA